VKRLFDGIVFVIVFRALNLYSLHSLFFALYSYALFFILYSLFFILCSSFFDALFFILYSLFFVVLHLAIIGAICSCCLCLSFPTKVLTGLASPLLSCTTPTYQYQWLAATPQQRQHPA
jgi:hypothetical protein